MYCLSAGTRELSPLKLRSRHLTSFVVSKMFIFKQRVNSNNKQQDGLKTGILVSIFNFLKATDTLKEKFDLLC